jgi:hypothetical protein
VPREIQGDISAGLLAVPACSLRIDNQKRHGTGRDEEGERVCDCAPGLELRQSLGVAGPPSSNAITKRVRYAIDTLVRAWSTGADPGSADKPHKGARSGRRARST